MKTTELIASHEMAIEILEGVQHFERLIKGREDSIKALNGNHMWLSDGYLHLIEIYRMCIVRLTERYKKIIDRVNELVVEGYR